MNADTHRPLLRSDVTRRIIGVYYDVYNELGFGFLESVYHEAMAIALEDAGLGCNRAHTADVKFRGRLVGQFRPDIVVADAAVVELKVARTLAPVHNVQVINYLRATPFEVGLLVNFGPEPQFRRFAFGNHREGSWHDPRPSA